MGVTLFFTLSGFLITGTVLAEREQTGRINLVRFYERRARRLLPAFLAVVAGTVLWWPFAGGWWLNGDDIAPVLLYYGNWVLIRPGTDLGVLTPTWSLAIEEQFYLLWPLIVLLVARRSWLLVVTLLLATASFVWRLDLIGQGASEARLYNGSDVVAFGLLMGAVVVMLRMGGGPGRRSTAGLVIALIGLAWVATWPRPLTIPLGIPLVAILAAVALWAVTGANPVPIIEWSWLRWFGSRSYGIYLVHVPIIWAGSHAQGPMSIPSTVVSLLASLAVAEISFRFIEAPFRIRRSALTSARDTSSARPTKSALTG
jgi:peptidoglycan/LPS O-acetylase OafA/YrhL